MVEPHCSSSSQSRLPEMTEHDHVCCQKRSRKSTKGDFIKPILTKLRVLTFLALSLAVESCSLVLGEFSRHSACVAGVTAHLASVVGSWFLRHCGSVRKILAVCPGWPPSGTAGNFLAVADKKAGVSACNRSNACIQRVSWLPWGLSSICWLWYDLLPCSVQGPSTGVHAKWPSVLLALALSSTVLAFMFTHFVVSHTVSSLAASLEAAAKGVLNKLEPRCRISDHFPVICTQYGYSV